MNDHVTLTLQESNKNIFVAKLLLILLFGSLTGYDFSNAKTRDYAKGSELTMEQYVANFDAHKAKLTDTNPTVVMGIAIFTFASLVFFGTYEIISRLIGFKLGKIMALT